MNTEAELEKLKGRAYTEEGIPMLLACHDLPRGWQRMQCSLPSADVCKRIELLAYRNFSVPARGHVKYAKHRLIRTVNFHNTPKAKAEQYNRELEQYSRCFSAVSEYDLDCYLETGRWHKEKPGLIVAVYEGYRNGFDVLAPLLERHGLTGWFFIITGFIDAAPGDQLAFAESYRIRMQTREYTDGRYAMTWDELRSLDGRHVIASHTRSHADLAVCAPEQREREIVGAQEDLTRELRHGVRTFVSRTGPALGQHSGIDRLIEAAGYNKVFSNLRIERVSSESS